MRAAPLLLVALSMLVAFSSSEPLASDECGVDELVDTHDLTAPDAPWADLCAVTMEHQLTENGELDSVTVVLHVAGLVEQRTETTAWDARLNTDDCQHIVQVDEAGYTGAVGVRVHSDCGRLEDQPCGVVGETLAELTGGACSAGQEWEASESTPLTADAVEFLADQVRVTFDPDPLGELGSGDLVAGATITVDALSATGVGSRQDGSRAAFDYDHARSTGRTYTFD